MQIVIIVVFLSTLSLRRATCWSPPARRCRVDFYPRSPCGERPYRLPLLHTSYSNFYPRSPCGERRPIPRGGRGEQSNFYPRSPCGERRYRKRVLAQSEQFLSTLSLRRATNTPIRVFRESRISIHALLAESDTMATASKNRYLHFYPRSPCGERPITAGAGTMILPFLSTLSLRRATGFHKINCQMMVISIHALLAESDRRRLWLLAQTASFLSTLSLRRATCLLVY